MVGPKGKAIFGPHQNREFKAIFKAIPNDFDEVQGKLALKNCLKFMI